MKDIPIIFSAPMIRALLDGRKTMTRRLAWRLRDVNDNHTRTPTSWQQVKPSDRLWVRESWYAAHQSDRCPPRGIPPGSSIVYGADKPPYADIGIVGKLRPGIFLPRWASRLTLIVTATKIERLQDISEDDARSEGVERGQFSEYETAFCAIWMKLHGENSWLENPEVVALTFTVHKHNIDAIEENSQCA